MTRAEKRKHPRHTGGGLWARVKIDGVLSEAHIENVSLGGALLGLRFPCAAGKTVLLELRGAQRDLRLIGRVVGAGTRRSSLAAARVRFNAPSASTMEQLSSLIRSLPRDVTFGSSRTDPEAFELNDLDLDIDVELNALMGRPASDCDEPTART